MKDIYQGGFMVQTKFTIKAVVQRNYKIKYSREGKWIIAEIPGLNLATHGETLKEVIENLKDLITDYMKDPDTPKPLTKIEIKFDQRSIPRGIMSNAQTQTPLKA